MRKPLSALLSLILVAQTAWADLPSMGDVSQQGLTPAQEREIGESAMREIRRSGELAEDPEVVAYLSRLGARLVDAGGVSDVRFTFFPILDGSVNAFAIPGGYVGVHTGLIVMARHESELASVLAHEIAHVSQHHLARMIDATSVNPLVSLASLGVAILAAHAGRVDAAATAVTAGAGFSVQRQLDFTYAFEQEADRIGMQTLIRGGFDPGAMPTFFERLHRHNRLEESNAPEFLRTHPVTTKRIADAQGRLTGLPYRQTPDSADFLFVREKARGLQMKPADAVEFYRKHLAEKRYANEAAHRYGLAHALYLARDYEGAWQALQRAKTVYGRKGHPALEYLAGSIRLAQGRNDEALAVFGKGVENFPSSRALAYGLIDAQTAAGKYDKAHALIVDYQSLYAGDPWFYQRAAKAYAQQGRMMESHKAQGEYYARLYEYGLAIEQLQIALKQPGNDFYLLSSIEARLRELENIKPKTKK
ncbi:Putative Zn-dependent protease, contains TPR repeats [Formivibrio citricus]|uniref:Zn-dependent protease, contains TPR repeats n=1 Tax=Formivibrio citricus TaxID=83765 RepID=A0A1I4ZSN2_9NEIS|nr:M48 family metalloprotease [Formivibrio citricus]SFN53000.1 Putative Zn-dependent protease, contains TPR repeats [Formivibrio citricus]